MKPTTIPPAAALPAKHPNLIGSVPRTRLAGGPYVDTTTTLAQFNTWAAQGVSQGVIIDRLTAHALKSGYCPVHDSLTRPAPAILTKTSPASPKSKRGR